jgi:hypothetical protein
MSAGQIGFEQLGIGSVLQRHSLHVPLNQREYSWTEREVGALFFDIAKSIQENAREYFLGSVVAIPRDPGVLEIVDGQQRLATTAILLAAIRNALRPRDSDKLLVERIENTFLTTIDARARARISRLRLNVVDGDFFDQRIMRADTTLEPRAVSHNRIVEAANLAERQVAAITTSFKTKDHGDVLNSWVEFIEHRAVVILLKVPSDVNAYRMFETLNDRGLRTSQSDLVKNYLFGESGERLPEAQQKWASMKALLESVDEDDNTVNFLRQMLISLCGYLREPDVYERVQGQARGAPSAIQFLSLLEVGAADYVALLNPAHEKWNKYPAASRRAVEAMILLKTRPIRPIALAVARKFDVGEADKALRLLLNLSVRLLVAGGTRSGTVEQGVAAAAQGISDGHILRTSALLQGLQKVIPNDSQFEEAFKTATVSQAYLARYYLRSLETTVRGEPYPAFLPNIDPQAINLEHIFPEKPKGNWPQFSPEVGAAFYRRIGNMALLEAKSNSDLSSAPFVEKKVVYSGSPYELTKELAGFPDWTADAVSERQARLAKIAVDTWPIDGT